MTVSRFVIGLTSCLLVSGAGAVEFSFSDSFVQIPTDQVWVSGSFNDWDATANPLAASTATPGAFSVEIPLVDGEYQYKFHVIDQEGNDYWINDPASPWYALDGFDGVNNVFLLEDGERKIPKAMELFSCMGDDAAWVNLAGDFNNWKQGAIDLRPDAAGIWSCWLKVERPVTFKFILPEKWETSFVNTPLPDGHMGENQFKPTTDYQELLNNPRFEETARTIARPQSPEEKRSLIRQAGELDRSREYRKAIASLRLVSDPAEARKGEEARLLASEALLEEARIHRRFGILDRAFECQDRIVRDFKGTPSESAALYQLADHRAFDKRNYEEARVLWRRLQEITTDPSELSWILWKSGITYEWENNWDAALKEFMKASDVLPRPVRDDKQATLRWAELECSIGISLVAMGRQREGIPHLESAIELSPWPDSEVVHDASTWLGRAKKELEVMNQGVHSVKGERSNEN